MNPLSVYEQQQNVGWTRIDMLLSLYDAVVDRLEQAVTALRNNDPEAARPHLVRAQLIVNDLAAGVDLSYGEIPLNCLRLYEFALHSLGVGTLEKVEGTLTVLRNLREGFQGIRDEAVQMERNGQIPPIDTVRTVQTTA